MILDDITVEVRDSNLRMVGALTKGFKLEATPLFNAVGTWELTIPSDHHLASALRTPGSGIVVTGPDDVIISGPTTQPAQSVTIDDPGGSTTFRGTSDNQWIADRLAYPDPAWDGDGETGADFDQRVGAPETVIHGFVNANAGPGATAGRKVANFFMGTNLARGGADITKAARWENLAELVTGIATAANLGWRVVQRGGALVFETSEVVDRSLSIRLDTRNRTLSGYKLVTSAPTTTHAIVGAQDVDLDRLYSTITTPESVTASTAWGRRIETFVNQAYVEDVDEWTASAKELLADQGHTVTSVQAIPNDDETLRFGRDYMLGDKIGIVADDREYSSVITGMLLKIDDAGVRLALILGDATVFDQTLALSKRSGSINSRVETLERTQAVPFAPYSDGITVWPTAFNVNSTTPGNVGNTITFNSPGTSAIFLVSFAVVGLAGGHVPFFSLAIDGAGWAGDSIRTHSQASQWFTASRTVRLTGLAAGSHTLGVRAWANSVAGTATSVNGPDSTLTIVRVA